MRDGIVDYELLEMLKAKDPKAAKKLARQVLYDFNNYSTEVANFRATRRDLLQRLSELASALPAENRNDGD